MFRPIIVGVRPHKKVFEAEPVIVGVHMGGLYSGLAQGAPKGHKREQDEPQDELHIYMIVKRRLIDKRGSFLSLWLQRAKEANNQRGDNGKMMRDMTSGCGVKMSQIGWEMSKF